MRYKEFLLEYSREKTLQNRSLMAKVMDAVRRKDSNIVSDLAGEDYVLDKFELIDPTPNKQYIQPLMNWYLKDKFRGFEDTGRLRDALKLFARFKQRLDKRDINQYADLHELEDAVGPMQVELTKKEKRQQGEYHIDPNSYDVFAESARYIVVIPNTSQASCSFGAGTKWCTASTGSSQYFNEYSKEGPLYIIRTKDANYDRDSIIATSNPIYQFHFESGQFMNVQDRPITLNGLTGGGPYDGPAPGTPLIDNELYSMFKEKFSSALALWVNNFFEKERGGGFENIWSDYVNQVPIYDVIRLMEQRNHGDGLKAVNGMLDTVGFTHWREHYYEPYKDLDMFGFIRGINEVVIPKLKKGNELLEYVARSSGSRRTWWEVTKADIRLYSEIGEYLRLHTYSIYDYEIGGMADEDNPIENIDKHYMRQKKIATILVAFQDILSEFAETADFVEDLKEWSFEYKRIHHWLGGWGMQGWTEKYVIPKILEEQGHSEDELQKIMSPLGYVQDIQKFVRDDIMNGKDYKRTWQGLI